ncbi:MAG TPA: tRNA glutamyl-Q(34) synthetase GluQRS, partial [Symbiobacteriaceae bacterium]|nr:tRNA glutamyl-Q(34) synthetase GluQRS [Symbiobacteriaceae bacterium]
MRRGRFAPTPSGQMHIGNARTALLAWLQIRHAGGRFVLRMEDIDKPRSRPDLAQQILDDLRWLGLDWDEGPDVGGPYAPYTQSEREELYHAALQQLTAEGWLYPCYCSRAEIMAIASAPHGLSAEGPVYPGTCRCLTPEQRAERAARGKVPSLRFAMPDEPVAFMDGVAGAQSFAAGAGGDFVVHRADGIIGYQLAVVVDDAAMQMTDVLRGWDLLDSTPRQLMLYRALGLTPPQFAHVPLLMGPDGSRLSKRHGSVAVASMRAAGAPAERVVGYIVQRFKAIASCILMGFQ